MFIKKDLNPAYYRAIGEYLETKPTKVLRVVCKLGCHVMGGSLETLPDKSRDGLIDFLVGCCAYGYLSFDDLRGFIENVE